jgi:hypothetical protein
MQRYPARPARAHRQRASRRGSGADLKELGKSNAHQCAARPLPTNERNAGTTLKPMGSPLHEAAPFYTHHAHHADVPSLEASCGADEAPAATLARLAQFLVRKSSRVDGTHSYR